MENIHEMQKVLVDLYKNRDVAIFLYLTKNIENLIAVDHDDYHNRIPANNGTIMM